MKIILLRSGPLLACFLGALGGLAGCGKDEEKQQAPPPAEVTVAHPVKREVTEWDEYIARLQSPDSVEIRARVGGYLDSIHFEDGQIVQKGDLLFTIDQRPFLNARDQAEAALAQAEANGALAQANFKRSQKLRKESVIATEAFDQASASAATAQASVDQARASLEAAQLELDYSTVTAPVTGRISRHLVSPGNLISGGSASAATLLTTIVTLDPIYAYFEVDEQSYLKYQKMIGRSGADEDTVVELQLADEESFPHRGRLNFVDNQVDSDTATIQLRAVFDNPEMTLTPGLFARVRLPGRSKHEATLVPDQAVSTDQSRQFVNVVDAANKVKVRAVKLGPIAQGLRIVRDGLTPEDRVIILGLTSARPGAEVKPKDTTVEEFMQSEKQAGDASPNAVEGAESGGEEKTGQAD